MDDLNAQAAEAPIDPVEEAKSPETRISAWKARITACKNYRRKLIPGWRTNIDFRRGKPFASQSDEDRVSVPMDWTLTKAKQASLFSQIPQVRVDHPPQTQAPGAAWIHTFETRLNDILLEAGVESAMDECLPDCINAAGIGAILCAYESITQMETVPTIDLSAYPPDQAQEMQSSGMMPDGTPIPTDNVPKILDYRYTVTRISPSDLLFPVDFTGSDFDNAPWLGRSGRLTWAEAVSKFGLTDQDKDSVVGEDRSFKDKLTHDIDRDRDQIDNKVGFDEIFYKSHVYDQEAQTYKSIHHMVFVNGKDQPVIDEPWKGQKIATEGAYAVVGSQKTPIRILTLSYITDDIIPPSDSAIGRSQVNEINKGRSQIIQQRDRSLPARWVDINRVDPIILQSLMKGVWQPFIPVQGAGDKIIGEVARANYAQEDFSFDSIIKSDLNEAWTVGPNQSGTGKGVETAEEARSLQENFTARISRERAKVGKFFVGVAEVIGGLACLFEDPSQFEEGFDPAFSKLLCYSILADSTVLLDSNQRIKKLMDFLNMTVQSGFVNPEPVLKEIATLSGLDPALVIRPPEPQKPPPPNLSIRMTGAQDLMNPLMLAFTIESGQAPKPESVEQAKMLISSAMQANPDRAPGVPMGGPVGEEGPVPPELPQGAPPNIGEAHPEWGLAPKINSRESEAGGGTQ